MLLKYYIIGSLKLFYNFYGKPHIILLKTVDLCLEMSSDFNYNFGYVNEEIFELGHTRKSRCFDIGKNSYSDSGVNSHKIISTKIEVEPCESVRYLFRNAQRF